MMKLLSRAEEIILVAILKLQDNAYGISIREEIRTMTGSRWSFASIYGPLNKLTRKHYVVKMMGEPTPERGGRSKCLYEMTPAGKAALRQIRRVQDTVWDGVSKLVTE